MEKRLFLFTILFTFIFMAACGNDQTNYMGGDPTPPEETEEPAGTEESEQVLRVMENDATGEYLADSDGMALYYFTNDEPETSNCADDCLANWPAFTVSDLEVPEGYEESDFDTITRDDTGEEQVTYKGYPLYYFINDTVEGDVNGQGFSGAWYIVNDSTEFAE
ncbi:COG4315 family predicted lipoprotein [Planococcus salinarum]|uniref:COG4315 family predicted lipoprotein n=1 Tax=Planococcus salinarum TaxID=622695 RepID=UPI000E3C4773|nr:hypothetical protein [Planococcus salinarum]TAA72731.1 hypothetical protein D2909_04985 [Planococcus salinarum]